MKKALFLLFFILIYLSAQAQNKDWSIEINYPFSVIESFGASNQGLVGLGLKYRFANYEKWQLGASLDGTWFSTEFGADSDPPQITDVRDLFLQPRFFADLRLSENNKWHFVGGLGWTFYQVARETFLGEEQIGDEKDWENGLNMNLGFTLNLSARWFMATQFDMIILTGDESDRVLGIVKIGAGFSF